MLKFLEDKLFLFRSCFSRKATFNWFLLIILALMVRYDSLGVTSFIRALSLNGRFYESMLHFFRSQAFDTMKLKNMWHKIVLTYAPFLRLNGRILLLGDGTKVPKEARRMPGVKKLYQESEDSSKPQFIHGHMFGGIGAVIGNLSKIFCIPLDLSLQDGLSGTASWRGGNPQNISSHVIQMIRNSHSLCQSFGQSCYCVLDRYFLTIPAFHELIQLNGSSVHRLDLITRAKNNCVAYDFPNTSGKPQRGRPRKKGDAVKISSLFSKCSEEFKKAQVTMYGETENIEYLSLRKLWGKKLYQEVLFVLVKSEKKGNAIFVSTDLTLNPLLVVEAYAKRFNIECMFRELKQQVAGFGYHFWTRSIPKLNKYKKKSDPDPLTGRNEKEQKRILLTIQAMERFVLCAEIAMGLVQLIALNPIFTKQVESHRYLRTFQEGKVSEATVMEYLRKNIFRLLSLNPHSYISRLILSRQKLDVEEKEAA